MVRSGTVVEINVVEIKLIIHVLCVRPQTLAERAWRSSIAVLESGVVLAADAPLPFLTHISPQLQEEFVDRDKRAKSHLYHPYIHV